MEHFTLLLTDSLLEPADYDITTTAFTFDSSTAKQCVNIGIVDDDIALEGAEDFFVSLETTDSGVTLDPNSARVFIESEDREYRIATT